MKKIKITGLFLALGMGLSGSSLYAATGDLININFGSGYESGAAYSEGEELSWNEESRPSGNDTSVYSAEGDRLSGVIFSWASDGYTVLNTSTFTSAPYLMDSYIYTTNKQGSFSFSGLSEGTYTLYIYSQSELSGQALSVSIAGTAYSTTLSNASSTTFISGQNYLVIENLTVSEAGTLTVSYGGTGTDVINGVQLLQTSDASAVPEPASIVLLGIGGALAAGYMKKRAALPSAVTS
jgi:hypothetical protein